MAKKLVDPTYTAQVTSYHDKYSDLVALELNHIYSSPQGCDIKGFYIRKEKLNQISPSTREHPYIDVPAIGASVRITQSYLEDLASKFIREGKLLSRPSVEVRLPNTSNKNEIFIDKNEESSISLSDIIPEEE